MPDAINLMKTAWNNRAQRDAYHYIETNQEQKRFFEVGEERAQLLIDPVLKKLGIDGSNKTVVDIGCGVGRFTQVLGYRFSKAIGIDVSDDMIDRAKTISAEKSNIEFIPSDGLSLPQSDKSVDFVWSYEVFQHMPSHDIIKHNLHEIARVLHFSGYGLLHFKSAYEHPTILGNVSRLFPNIWVRAIKRLLGRDPLTDDEAWRGAKPLSKRSIQAMCKNAELEVIEFRDDPTHKAGTRIFALVRPTSS